MNSKREKFWQWYDKVEYKKPPSLRLPAGVTISDGKVHTPIDGNIRGGIGAIRTAVDWFNHYDKMMTDEGEGLTLEQKLDKPKYMSSLFGRWQIREELGKMWILIHPILCKNEKDEETAAIFKLVKDEVKLEGQTLKKEKSGGENE